MYYYFGVHKRTIHSKNPRIHEKLYFKTYDEQLCISQE